MRSMTVKGRSYEDENSTGDNHTDLPVTKDHSPPRSKKAR